MTGITQGPVGINSHVPVESTADAWQESKLLGCVVSWIRLPIEAIKTVAGILYSVVDKGELASRSLKNLGISLIGSCPVLGAIGVTALHQRKVTSLSQIENFTPKLDDVKNQEEFLKRFFQKDPSKLSLRYRIGAHLILQNMSVEDLINLYKEYKKNELIKSATIQKTDLIAPQIADFLLDRITRDPNSVSTNNFATLIQIAKEIDSDQLPQLKQIGDERAKEWWLFDDKGKDLSIETLNAKLAQLRKQKDSVWRNELIAHLQKAIAEA